MIPNSPTQYRGTHTPTHTSSRVRVSFSLHRSSKIDSRPRFGRFPRTDFTRAYPVAPSPHAITASLHALPFHHTSQIRTIPYAGAVFRSALRPQRTTISSPVRHPSCMAAPSAQSDPIRFHRNNSTTWEVSSYEIPLPALPGRVYSSEEFGSFGSKSHILTDDVRLDPHSNRHLGYFLLRAGSSSVVV